ncbi:MAG: hypothetical protein CVU56_08235 [Deltaproteobacteria bacterium HGW-Deltaproteobacteria-14]|jgi:membrane-associated phospholipid phosphatase|nr:MAG: hypothetical protein CVU56_08235 [Deltaproteobacteria bacterium HGW-Deltaproteobacteria-14]
MKRFPALLAVVAAFAPRPATAEPPSSVVRLIDKPTGEPLDWDPAWGDFGIADWVLTGTAAAGILATVILPPVSEHWRGGVGPDEGVRDAMRLDTEGGRRTAREVSDVTLTLSVTYPLLVDGLVVAGWYRRSPEIAARMALIDAEVIAVALAVQGLTNVLVSRERPYGRECGQDEPASGRDCTSSDRYRSFFSGHTTAAFAAAAVGCSHHVNLALYGDPVADGVACAGAFGVAAFTGLMRIAGDKHYLSDVLVGAGVGTLIGFGLPWLLHYRFGDDAEAAAGAPAAASVSLVPFGNGAALMGVF